MGARFEDVNKNWSRLAEFGRRVEPGSAHVLDFINESTWRGKGRTGDTCEVDERQRRGDGCVDCGKKGLLSIDLATGVKAFCFKFEIKGTVSCNVVQCLGFVGVGE